MNLRGSEVDSILHHALMWMYNQWAQVVTLSNRVRVRTQFDVTPLDAAEVSK